MIEHGNTWAVDLRGSDARVLVDPQEGPEPIGQNGAAVPAGAGERRPELRREQPAPREPAAVDLDIRGGDDRSGNDEDAGHYYAPEQAARLLGEDVHAGNLRVYRKELPTVDIKSLDPRRGRREVAAEGVGAASELLGLLVTLGLISFVVRAFVGPCPSY